MNRVPSQSLERRLVAIIMASILLPTLTVGWLGYSSTFETTKNQKIRNVGSVADSRHQELVSVLEGANARAHAFVADVRARCARRSGAATESCANEALVSFVRSERALGAVLRLPELADPLAVDSSATVLDTLEPLPGQFARFDKPTGDGARTYHVIATDRLAESRLVVTFPVELIQRLFVTSPDLGESGETFLADEDGFFITKARYPSPQGHSHAISARPMQECLAGGNREVLDQDYRDVAIIHGFRFVPQIGGGCIMAHIDQAEAFAPLNALQWRLAAATLAFVALAGVLSFYLGRGIVRPIVALTRVSRAIMNGQYDACVVVSGNDEIAELARSFNRMAERLGMTVGELREHKALLEQRVSERTRELEAANELLGTLSRSDGLTGLANRRALDEMMTEEWRRAARMGLPMAMILTDVDHFKLYNDHYGHQAGDDCLRRVAAVLASHVRRAGELAARYGGEEFVIVLPGTNAAEATALAEAARLAVADLRIPHAGSESFIVTISLGVAAFVPQAGDEVSVLVAEADKALYRAKAEGRNRVALAVTKIAAE